MVTLESPCSLSSGVHLILGGARCGKSLFAERLVGQVPRPIYLATAQAEDQEMERRIARHRQRRPPHWITVEEPLDLVSILRKHSSPETTILVDCLTLWLSNLLQARRDLDLALARFLDLMPNLSGTVVFVTNEVGLGGVPLHASGREFLDYAGTLHQQIAQYSRTVLFIVSGLPITLKHR